MTEEVQLKQKEIDDKTVSERDDKSPSRSPTVNKERIERLKKAFRPSWLHEMINAPDNGSSGKNK